MGNLDTYKQQITEIQALINKLSDGELMLEELVNLEKLTREIHEKSIILKYKAFEKEVKGELSSVAETQVEATPELEEEEIVEEAPKDEGAPIEFALFDDDEPEEPQSFSEPVNPISVTESVPEPEIEEPIEEVKEEIVVTEEPQPVVQISEGDSIWDRVNMEDNSLGSQFVGTKIDSLVGAFGLNQKLRYINDLFDGSSESFGDTIKLLDSLSNLDEAKIKVEGVASQYEWDPEEESVAEFISIVNRRYA